MTGASESVSDGPAGDCAWPASQWVALPKATLDSARDLAELGGISLLFRKSLRRRGRPLQLAQEYTGSLWGGSKRRGAAILSDLEALGLARRVAESEPENQQGRMYQLWRPPRAQGFVKVAEGWPQDAWISVPVRIDEVADAVLRDTATGVPLSRARAQLLGLLVRLFSAADDACPAPINLAARGVHRSVGRGQLSRALVKAVLDHLLREGLAKDAGVTSNRSFLWGLDHVDHSSRLAQGDSDPRSEPRPVPRGGPHRVQRVVHKEETQPNLEPESQTETETEGERASPSALARFERVKATWIEAWTETWGVPAPEPVGGWDPVSLNQILIGAGDSLELAYWALRWHFDAAKNQLIWPYSKPSNSEAPTPRLVLRSMPDALVSIEGFRLLLCIEADEQAERDQREQAESLRRIEKVSPEPSREPPVGLERYDNDDIPF